MSIAIWLILIAIRSMSVAIRPISIAVRPNVVFSRTAIDWRPDMTFSRTMAGYWLDCSRYRSDFHSPMLSATGLVSGNPIVSDCNLDEIWSRFDRTLCPTRPQSVFDQNRDVIGRTIGGYDFGWFKLEFDRDPIDADPLKFIDLLSYSIALMMINSSEQWR